MAHPITKRDEKGRIMKGNAMITGLSSSPIYDCWVAMKARCLKTNHPIYNLYGGRGIKVCDRWLNSFENFLEDMGHKPSPAHTLDRINNDGDYEPSNCRWITIQEQQKNRRNNTDSPGVEFESSRNKWRALIKFKGKRYFLGRFENKADAIKERYLAEQRLWCNKIVVQ